MRSKTRSASNSASKRRDKPHVYFVDRSLGGKVVPEALRRLGLNVEVHDDHFAQNETDRAWLAAVARKGWIILSKDSAIRRRLVERQEIINAGASAFFLIRGNLTGLQMAEAFNKAIPAIRKILDRTSGPVLGVIRSDGSIGLLDGNLKKQPQSKKPRRP
ncbi:MAG: hypothetical protein ACREMP_06195 [Candidatus Tyrphobacter sp.]